MLKKSFIILIFVLLLANTASSYPTSSVYDNNWYIKTDKSSVANQEKSKAELLGIKKWNKVERVLYTADRPHRPTFYKRYSNTTHREYVNCSYFKHIDCSNFAFCRCWQCRDYAYPVVRTGY